MKYRKKPIEVEAHQMTEDQFTNYDGWPDWLKGAWEKPLAMDGAFFKTAEGGYWIRNQTGVHRVSVDAYIVCKADGVIHTFSKSTFEEMYTKI